MKRVLKVDYTEVVQLLIIRHVFMYSYCKWRQYKSTGIAHYGALTCKPFHKLMTLLPLVKHGNDLSLTHTQHFQKAVT